MTVTSAPTQPARRFVGRLRQEKRAEDNYLGVGRSLAYGPSMC